MKKIKRTAIAITGVLVLLVIFNTFNFSLQLNNNYEQTPLNVSNAIQTESEHLNVVENDSFEAKSDEVKNRTNETKIQNQAFENSNNGEITKVNEHIPPVKGAEVLEKGKNEDGTSKSIIVYGSESSNILYDEKDDINYVNNIIIMFFQQGTSNERRLEIIETVGGECVGYMDTVNQWQVKIEETNLPEIKQKCAKLLEFDEVIYAKQETANKIVTCLIPDDPFGNYFWNEDAPAGHNWGQEAIQLPSAWDYQAYFNNISVGIVDDGFYIAHEELDGIIEFPSMEAEQNNIKARHGTHISGIIGAKANNQVGIAGVLWDTTIYAYDYSPVEAAGQQWDFATAIYAGLVECVEQGAKVVNFSIGLSIPAWETEISAAKIAEEAETASMYMAQLINTGHEFIVVQSAGNGNRAGKSLDAINNGMFCCVKNDNTGQSPAMAQKINDRIIIVGCAQNTGNKTYQQAYFSNSGEQIDICSPGYGIYSCDVYDDGGGDENPYISLAGTSQSAAFVSGVVGLAWSVNPDLTGAQVRSIICDSDNQPYTVDYNTKQNHPLELSYGLLNAKLCVEGALLTVPADYTELNNAIAQANLINVEIYTAQSIQALNAALNSVETGLSAFEQDEVDLMAQNILDAISQLVLREADYSGVDNALAQAASINEVYYTAQSINALNNAIESVVRELTILEQGLVDDMENAIMTALNDLVALTQAIVPQGSTAVVNEEYSLIYGLDYNLTAQRFESEYVIAPLGCSFEYIYYKLGALGTGSVVRLIDDSTGDVIAQYSIVIVGDVDGDSFVTSADSTIIISVVGKIVDLDKYSPFWFAADVFSDADLNTADMTRLISAIGKLEKIDQNALTQTIAILAQ
ncbi:MAG TPA: S8/S53 family peptidase [Clostridia bacterium]|nr:S8/S53 family peptidase [Clostridia bacterium]